MQNHFQQVKVKDGLIASLPLATLSPCPEEIGARVSIHTCTLICLIDCFYLFEFACGIQDLCIRKRQFLTAEACQICHLG